MTTHDEQTEHDMTVRLARVIHDADTSGPEMAIARAIRAEGWRSPKEVAALLADRPDPTPNGLDALSRHWRGERSASSIKDDEPAAWLVKHDGSVWATVSYGEIEWAKKHGLGVPLYRHPATEDEIRTRRYWHAVGYLQGMEDFSSDDNPKAPYFQTIVEAGL